MTEEPSYNFPFSKSFIVDGHAETKGSAKAFPVKGRCIITNDNPKCKRWQQTVASRACAEGVEKRDAVHVSIRFEFAIPKSAIKKRTGNTPHTQKPDIDKLIRPILDALTGIAYADDSAVVSVTAEKRWSDFDRVKISIFDLQSTPNSVTIYT